MAATLLLAAALLAQPTVEVAGHMVTVRGVTPGAQVALFGAGWGQGILSPFLFDWAGAGTDEDADGEVRIIPPTGHGYDTTVSHSVWVAVDLTSGAWGTAVLDLGDVWQDWRAFALDRSHLVWSVRGGLAIRPACGAPPGSTWAVAVARPGRGLWTATASEPGGGAAFAVADLTPTGLSGPPPLALGAGDVVVAVNSGAFCYAVATLGAVQFPLPRARRRAATPSR